MLTISRITKLTSYNSILSSIANQPTTNYLKQGPIAFKIAYCFSSHSILQDLNQIKQGHKFYQQLNISATQEMLERALNIVPFFIAGNAEYNNEFQNILDILIRAYAWKGEIAKIQQLLKRIQEAKTTNNIQNWNKINYVIQVMGLVGKSEYQLSTEKKGIRDLYLQAKRISMDAKYELDTELTLNDKTQQPNTDNIESWIHGQLRDTWTFVVLSLLSRRNIYSNQQYNKLCSTLLKNSERSSQKNVVKPLILLISNLLRNQQYLQAQGMLSYCLDRKKDNLKPELLRYNQEYIMLNLLLAKTFRGVKREAESLKLLEQNRKRFDLTTLVLQGYLLDSI